MALQSLESPAIFVTFLRRIYGTIVGKKREGSLILFWSVLMSISSVTVQEASGEQATGRTEAVLTGRWLAVLRLSCIAIIVVTIALWIVAIPIRYRELGSVCSSVCGDQQLTRDSLARFRASGLTLGFYSAYVGTLEVLFVLTFVVIALVILWKKSDTRIGLLTALFLTTYGASNTDATALSITFPVLSVPVGLIELMSWACLGIFLFVFPDGRFSPRWMFFLSVVVVVMLVLGNAPFFPPALFIPFLLGFVLLTLIAKIYRYRFVYNAAQRQQTKWVILGVITAIVGIIGLSTLVNVFSLPQYPTGYFPLFGDTMWYVFELLIPLSIGFAIVRSKLWDIDVVINRALVYGTLTIILGLIYFGVVLGLQFVVGNFTAKAQSPLIIVASTLLIAALFQPLRRRIQSIIDRRFYRRKYDAARTLAAFSASLRSEVDLSQLSEQLIAVVEETMQPTHVSLWVRPSLSQKRMESVDEQVAQ